VIIADGFDEFNDAETKMYQKIQEINKDLTIRLIVTCRENTVPDDAISYKCFLTPEGKTPEVLYICPFSAEQQ
jgi:hypothetical protein